MARLVPEKLNQFMNSAATLPGEAIEDLLVIGGIACSADRDVEAGAECLNLSV